MTQDTIIDLVRNGLFTIVLVSGPPLIIGLVIGIVVSMFQTITSINEQTLVFIPKIMGILVSLILFGAFMLTTINDYMVSLYNQIPQLLTPR